MNAAFLFSFSMNGVSVNFIEDLSKAFSGIHAVVLCSTAVVHFASSSSSPSVCQIEKHSLK